jgi:hypothetical protein
MNWKKSATISKPPIMRLIFSESSADFSTTFWARIAYAHKTVILASQTPITNSTICSIEAGIRYLTERNAIASIQNRSTWMLMKFIPYPL